MDNTESRDQVDNREAHVGVDLKEPIEDSDEGTRQVDEETDDIGREVETQLLNLQAELKTAQDRLLRQAAEFQNARRRLEEEVRMATQYGKLQVIGSMLDVYDDFRRSIQAADEVAERDDAQAAFDALHEGVKLVFKKFGEQLERFDVQPIEAVGEPFHEDEHEAMMQQPAPEGTEPGTVLGEVQKGYKMGDRVIRHAKVIVAQ